MSHGPLQHRQGRALGCEVRLGATGDDRVARAALDAGWDRLDELEARWSRFRPDADVSRCNAAAGRAVAVHPETLDVIEAAVHAWQLTGGLVDPTVLPALEAAGYDRSFEQLAPPTGHPVDAPAPPVTVGTPPRVPGCAGIEVDRTAGTVRLPADVRLDLGGIGKGRIADLVAATMVATGATGAVVDLRGDVAVAGTSPDGDGWGIAIADPLDERRTLTTVVLAAGAVATSATTRRRWHADGADHHHLIDPRTGRPAESDLVAVTVVAAEAAWAEVLAKATLIAGLGDGVGRIVEAGATGIAVTSEGFAVRTAGFDDFEAPDLDPTRTEPALAGAGQDEGARR